MPSHSPGRLGRVVCEIETRRSGSDAAKALTRLVLPAPEGAETIKRIPSCRGIVSLSLECGTQAAPHNGFFHCRVLKQPLNGVQECANVIGYIIVDPKNGPHPLIV